MRTPAADKKPWNDLTGKEKNDWFRRLWKKYPDIDSVHMYMHLTDRMRVGSEKTRVNGKA